VGRRVDAYVKDEDRVWVYIIQQCLTWIWVGFCEREIRRGGIL